MGQDSFYIFSDFLIRNRERRQEPDDILAGSQDEQPRIRKVYQLSLSEDPSLIPTGDFQRDGRLYYLLDMTRKDEVGVDTKPHIETITMASNTDDMAKILQHLEAQVETTTEDGYTGLLNLDHTTVKVAAALSLPSPSSRTFTASDSCCFWM